MVIWVESGVEGRSRSFAAICLVIGGGGLFKGWYAEGPVWTFRDDQYSSGCAILRYRGSTAPSRTFTLRGVRTEGSSKSGYLVPTTV